MNVKDEKFVIAAIREIEIKVTMINTAIEKQRKTLTWIDHYTENTSKKISRIEKALSKIADILEESL